jgi:hypothetical protein
MEDKELDKIIRERMEDYAEDYDPRSWQSLSDRLDSDAYDDVVSEGEDELFDETVRSAVEGFEEPYQSSTWPILLSKVHAIEAFEFKVVLTKSLEGIMIFLILFAGMRFIPALGPGYAEIKKEALLSPVNGANGQIELIDPSPSPDLDGQKKNIFAEEDNLSTTLKQNIGFDLKENESISGSKQIPESEGRTLSSRNSNVVSPVSYAASLAEVEPAPHLMGVQLSHASARKVSQIIPGQDPKPLDVQKRLWTRGVKPPIAAGWSIGAFAATDFNHIITPYDEIYERAGYEQYRLGYGGGISLQYGTRTVRLETGLGYSSKHYAPPKVVEIFRGDQYNEFYSVSLENIELNTLSIPFNVHYTTNPKSRWQVYMLGGLTVNLVVETDYDKTQEAIYALSLPTGGPETKVNLSRSARIDKKDFNKGLFQGGSLNDNNFVTFNAGVGVERIIDSKWSVYAQPTYHSNLFGTGLGPNNDKIHIFSLFMGARMRLN